MFGRLIQNNPFLLKKVDKTFLMKIELTIEMRK